MFDPKSNEEEYCKEYNEALNDNTTVGGVVVEPTYDYDDNKYIDHKDQIYDGIQKLLCGVNPLMPPEKMELDGKFFTDSDFSWNNL